MHTGKLNTSISTTTFIAIANQQTGLVAQTTYRQDAY
jgi:hypothetical protein